MGKNKDNNIHLIYNHRMTLSCKISVIVPVYNTELFLRKCIDSLLSQTYTNFELLLVNDGSTDKSGEICDEYLKKDDRIRVFHKENGGVSSARNLGIDKACGSYLTFCDSDDYVSKDYLEKLLPLNGEDLVCCSFANACNNSISMNDSEDVKDILKKSGSLYVFGSVCCKLYKMSKLKQNKVCFRNDISMGEDILFVLDYLNCNVASISTKPDYGYFYNNINESSLTHRIVPLDQSFKIIELLYEKIQSIEKLYDCDCSYMRNEYLCSQLFNIIKAIKLSKKSFSDKIQLLFRTINNKYIYNLISDKHYWNLRGSGSGKKNMLIKIGLSMIRVYYMVVF